MPSRPRESRHRPARISRDGLLSLVAAMRLVPNQLTAVRFIAVPMIWIFALAGQLTYVGIGLVLCCLSDLLDGAAARRLDQCSDFGSKFDSLADQLLQISAVFWIALLMPQMVTENPLLSGAAISLYFASLLAGLIKFRRLANLHLYSSKVAAFFLFIFLIHAFLTGQYSPLLLLLAGALFILSSAETLALQLMSPSVDAGMGSILLRSVPKTHPLRRWLARLP
ncbi:MAG: CDP-alcohol phosphatidyltransferase family protein [Candidatus Promineifilaceae bacterium]